MHLRRRSPTVPFKASFTEQSSQRRDAKLNVGVVVAWELNETKQPNGSDLFHFEEQRRLFIHLLGVLQLLRLLVLLQVWSTAFGGGSAKILMRGGS
jgi:hypothetical protein